jgi:redox-sensitive bicupin YhaK (pirin superfamily)
MIGAFCFVDHYGGAGPRSRSDSPMVVPPHPHMGLQTVSWLLEGSIDHFDSLGSRQRVRPGELNLMTAGEGISHSEYSAQDGNPSAMNAVHGVQLWVALPDSDRHQVPHFEHHAELPTFTAGTLRGTVIMGTFMDLASEALTYSSLVCVEIAAPPGRHVLHVAGGHEHGLLPLDREVLIGAELVPRGAMRYEPPGQSELTIDSPAETRLLVLGGTPFDEELVMWWNFVGRSHDEMVNARNSWESGERFGFVVEDENPRIPAPEIPGVRLRPRPPRRE